MHKALQQAVKLNYLRYNPCNACELPRVEGRKIEPIAGEHVKEFMQAVKGHRFEGLFLLALFTGMREGEVIGLTWDNVDFRRGTITVRQQLQRERVKGGRYRFTSLKNDKQRTITPAPYVFDILRSIQRQQKELRLKCGGIWENQMNLVFTNEIGGNLLKVTVYKSFKRVVKSIGIPSTRFHDLRHTFATLSLQNGDDVKTVSENLGHATVAFTLDVYGHVTEQMKQDSANRMQAFIQNL